MAYEKLSEERKKLQEQGLCPQFWSIAGIHLYSKTEDTVLALVETKRRT